MISSGETSEIFAAQTQAVMGQANYASRIGLPGSGLGTYGPVGGGSQPFSFAPGGFLGPGYGGGNRFAATGVSAGGALSGAASFGSTYLGLAGMVPGRLAGALPFGAFAATTGGALAATGLGLAATAVGATVRGGQQQFAFNNMLSSYSPFNPSSRTGMGFNREDSAALGGLTQRLAQIPEMLTSMDELTRVVGRLRSTGVMQGVRNATEFAGRFREALGTIRETAKILGSTMEESETFFAHSRSIGFLGRSDQLRNALNVQLTSGMTGMNIGQVMGLQQAGANMASSIGARRSLGARAITTIAQNIGAAQRAGSISPGLIEDITGQGGAEGVAAVSERLTNLVTRMAMGTAGGQFMLAGMTKFTNGRASFDEEMGRRFQQGTVSFAELQRRGMSLTDAQKISFKARQGDLAAGFAASQGPGGVSRFLGGLVEGRGPEAENLLLQMNGATSGEADLMRQLRGASSDLEFSQFGQFRAREADIRERRSPSAAFRRLATKLHTGTFGPLEKAGQDIFTSLGRAYDEWFDDLVGRHVVTLTKAGASAFAQAMSGPGRKELDAMFSAAAGAPAGSTSVMSDVGKFLGINPRADAAAVENLFGASGQDLVKKISGPATGGEGLADVIDRIKASDINFQSKSPSEQLSLIRRELVSQVVSGGGDLNMNEEQLRGLARGGGAAGAASARLIRAAQASRGPAKDPITNLILSAEKTTTGPRLQLQRLYDAEAVAASRDSEKLEKLRRGADENLRGLGLRAETIQAIKDSPAIRKNLNRAAAGDREFLRVLNGPDSDAIRKLGVSQEELPLLRDAERDITRAVYAGKNVASVLGQFDTAQAAGNLNVMAQSFKVAGAEAAAGAEILKGTPLERYSSALGDVGSALSKFDEQRNKESFDVARNSVRDFYSKVFNDKSLSPEQRAQLARSAGGSLGGSIHGMEQLKGLVGKSFTKEALADKLGIAGPEAMEMLEGLGFTTGVATKLDTKKFDDLRDRSGGLLFARNTSREGQANVGQGLEDRLITTLQKIDSNQSMIATILAKQAGLNDEGTKFWIEQLGRSYQDSEGKRR